VPELAKTYDPVGTEARWQQAWEEQGAFHPDPAAEGEPFAVVIPPPNVTGSLHMGHAFNTALDRHDRPLPAVGWQKRAVPSGYRPCLDCCSEHP
jgi:arginyl-tRNA synthetase